MRTTMAVCLALLLGLIAPRAEAVNGEQLLDGLRAAEDPSTASSFKAGLSLGYVYGAADAANSDRDFCNFSGSTISIPQIAAIVKKYLEANPAKWQQEGDILVVQAMREAFPCPHLNK